MLNDIFINLLSSVIGFGFAQGISLLKNYSRELTTKQFWGNTYKKIYIYWGHWRNVLSDIGEVEPVINAQDALTLGELRFFLKKVYGDVIIVNNINQIDWNYPVVSLGGPLCNNLTYEIGKKGHLPIWFLNLPYNEESDRILGNNNRTVIFKSEFNETKTLVADVGFVAKMRSPYNRNQTLYVIASNYGIGNLGVVRFITTASNLRKLKISTNSLFQAVIRTKVKNDTIVETECIYHTNL